MARDIISDVTSPTPSGSHLAANYAGHFGVMYDTLAAPLTSVTGTNSISATVNADFLGNGLQVGQRVLWQQPATTTSSTLELALNGGTAQPVLDSEGNAPPIGALAADQWVLAVWGGSSWHVLSPLATGTSAGQPRYHWQYLSNATWTKPAGLSADTLVTVILVGAGGGGGANNGGGGGAASIGFFRLGDLSSTVSVTVPSGGAGGTTSPGAGGNTTFGGYLTAYGGGPGASAGAGGGGGAAGAGTAGASGALSGTIYSGGDGSADATDGGIAYYGGGGGASTTTGSNGGASIMSGDGGDAGAAGAAPGGGGGASASGVSSGFDGGRGQADIFI